MTTSAWRTLLFPLALVLFEFTVNISNDMIMPAMPHIVHMFNADPVWISRALTAYMAGAASLPLILGPLADRIGYRRVLLVGVFGFAVTSFVTTVAGSIEQLTLGRFVQGMGISFVASVGYAAIHQMLDEKQAVKMIALMANVGVIAPILGPSAGALVLTIASWHVTQYIAGALAFGSFIGLYLTMPRHVPLSKAPAPWGAIIHEYREIFSNRQFWLGTLSVCGAALPILAWLGVSPMILIYQAQLSPLAFGLCQLPIFGALMVGNLCVARWVHRVPLARMVLLGLPILAFGLVFAAFAVSVAPHQYGWLVAGVSIYGLGLGVVNGPLRRMTLYSSDLPKGAVSGAFNTIFLLTLATGVEVFSRIYEYGGELHFATALLVNCGACIAVILLFARHVDAVPAANGPSPAALP